MLATIASCLKARVDHRLVDELLEAYQEAKRNYYLGGLRLSEVEGGRFSEAALRILQEQTSSQRTFTPLGRQLDTDTIIRTLAQLPVGSHSDSTRLHIPRALRVIYDIRNNRDAAHLGDGIDPNRQDATLVVSVLDWVLAEFIRMFHNVSADQAQQIVGTLVTRRVPVVQVFGDFPRVLNTSLRAGDYMLVLLYHRGERGANLQDLSTWVRPTMRRNLRKTLERLVDGEAYVHFDGQLYFITELGMRVVEQRRLFDVPVP